MYTRETPGFENLDTPANCLECAEGQETTPAALQLPSEEEVNEVKRELEQALNQAV